MRYVPAAELGYERIRRDLSAGGPLRLDESYRLAHLPLLAPAHPDAIASRPGTDYDRGRYTSARRSLVVPIPADRLEASPAFRALDHDVRQSRLAAKVAWTVMQARRSRLHATLANGIGPGPAADAVAALLRAAGTIRSRLGGPLVGERNLGRIYLPLVPEVRDGGNPLRLVQELAGVTPTGLYLVGYYSLTDHLDAEETAALAAMLDRHGRATMLEGRIERLWLMETHDDLALDSRVVAELP